MNNSERMLYQFLHSCKHLPVVLCIGSPSVIGDCFGALTGQLLCDFFNLPTFVYGTVLSPVNALNLASTLSFIKARHKNRKIIAVDCAVSQYPAGHVNYFYGAIKPGLATNKDLPKAGDFSITASVGASTAKDLFFVNFKSVYKLSYKVASIISQAVNCKVEPKKNSRSLIL